jgi:hypothetical protein
MPIQTFTTATTIDWSGKDILVDESYWDTYVAAEGSSNLDQVYNNGVAQGLITIIGED